jgi:hypothetical protein
MQFEIRFTRRGRSGSINLRSLGISQLLTMITEDS